MIAACWLRPLAVSPAASPVEPAALSAETPANSALIAPPSAELQRTSAQLHSLITAESAANLAEPASIPALPELTYPLTDNLLPRSLPG